MAILVPDQESIDLRVGRGSSIQPMDTYAKPAVQDKGGGLMELSKALSNLGGQFSELGAEKGAGDENLDRRRADYYANVLRPEIKDGVPVEVQLGKLRPEMSATVRALVSESMLQERGNAFARAEYEKLQTDPDTRLSPEKMAQWRENTLAKAREAAGREVTGGAAYFRSVQRFLDEADNNAMNERTGIYNKYQDQKLVEDTINGGNDAYKANDFGFRRVADVGIQSYRNLPKLFGDKDPSHFENLNADFAYKLDAMVAAAPEGIRDQLKAISGFRSKERQAELFADAVKRYGSEAAARKWVAPPGGSNHNHGEATDFDHGREFANTPAGKWVHANAEQFGLYFPMAHEPWHIEMKGGRRDSGGKSTMVGSAGGDRLNDTDGPDNHDPVARVASRIVNVPSVEGYGKNPRSSAEGVGQFTKGTWIAEVRSQDRETAKGKTDEEILALRNDPKYAATIVTGFTQKNADRLKSAGLPVSEANLYLMHFAGEGDGPKVIKASDGTRVADVMSKDSLEANPFLKGMTVGQLKQFAAEKGGGVTGPISAARNAIRSIDQTYAAVGGLDNIRRRDVISAGLMKNATESLDPKYLQYMPPELMTPSLQLQFAQAERQIGVAQRQQRMQELQDKKIARDQEVEQGKDQITQAIGAGKTINPADYAGNSELFDYASKFNKYQDGQIDEAKSKAMALDYNDRLTGAVASKQWSRINPSWTDGQAPTMAQIRQDILNNPDIKASDKVALMGEISKTLDTANFVASDEMTQYFDKQMGDTIKGLYQNPMGQFARKFDGVDVYGQVRETYLNALRMGAQAAAEDGKDLKGETKLRIVEAAEAKARQKLKDISESIGATSSKDSESKSQPKAKEPAKSNEPDTSNADGLELKKIIVNGKATWKRVPKGSTVITGDAAKDAEIAKDRASRMVAPGRSGAPPKQ